MEAKTLKQESLGESGYAEEVCAFGEKSVKLQRCEMRLSVEMSPETLCCMRRNWVPPYKWGFPEIFKIVERYGLVSL